MHQEANISPLPLGDGADPVKTTSLRRLAGPVVLLAIASLAAIGGVAILASSWLDTRVVLDSQSAVRGTLEVQAEDLQTLTRDYATWDTASRKLSVESAPQGSAWFKSHIGRHLGANFNIDAISVIEPDQKIALSIRNGKSTTLDDGLDAARRDLAERARSSSSCAQSIVVGRNGPRFAAACPMQQRMASNLDFAHPAVLILERPLDEGALQRLLRSSYISAMQVVRVPNTALSETMHVLTAHPDRTVTVLAWQTRKPGNELLQIAAGPIIAVIVCMISLGAIFLWRLSNAVQDMAATTRARVQSELRYRTLVSTIPEMIAIVRDERITYINSSGASMIGMPSRAIRGAHVNDLFEHGGTVVVAAEKDQGRWKDTRLLRANGKFLELEITTRSIHDGTGDALLLIGRDVSERRRNERRLKRAKEQAEVASRTKGQFLANMSHELRTPLNAIIGFSDAMGHEILGPLGQIKYKDYALAINDSGKHLLGLIEEILNFAKMEAGHITLNESETDLGEIARTTIRVMRSQAEKNKVELVEKIDANLPLVWADSVKMKQILLNLLSNAVKFTPHEGRVSLDVVRASNGELVMEVADTGIGMSEEELQIALEPFGQVESEMSRRHHGTGLGLPLTKSLVEMHDGKFEIASEPGIGTRIRVRLPISRLRTHAQADSSASSSSEVVTGDEQAEPVHT